MVLLGINKWVCICEFIGKIDSSGLFGVVNCFGLISIVLVVFVMGVCIVILCFECCFVICCVIEVICWFSCIWLWENWWGLEVILVFRLVMVCCNCNLFCFRLCNFFFSVSSWFCCFCVCNFEVKCLEFRLINLFRVIWVLWWCCCNEWIFCDNCCDLCFSVCSWLFILVCWSVFSFSCCLCFNSKLWCWCWSCLIILDCVWLFFVDDCFDESINSMLFFFIVCFLLICFLMIVLDWGVNILIMFWFGIRKLGMVCFWWYLFSIIK